MSYCFGGSIYVTVLYDYTLINGKLHEDVRSETHMVATMKSTSRF